MGTVTGDSSGGLGPKHKFHGWTIFTGLASPLLTCSGEGIL